MNFYDYVRNIQNFPKAGINFKDISPLLADKHALANCLSELVVLVGSQKIDKVAAIESRGFYFGTLLAHKLEAGFVPIRKPGKLPFKTIKEPYELEYGIDVLEIHEDAIEEGDRILLHDDVLATGGTARAACNLIERLGGKIVQCNFILELEFLYGIKKLQDHSVCSFLKF
ncbi:adenine phosphoribosyltransferase [Aequorivita sp. SDUM287046]|uniref:Adenine phosphoribosyltransferase n=1 Tax=Aequorivita aurantiaca TaxID=3053356 RepID=A0ABT8DL38_9FLAO|nr:adenine phosphoribosyltransferase [Aequorivita aurantiaca]MDN3724615.1 adenine phosphoribosyltransferase [Aequorivita aurantiaca]